MRQIMIVWICVSLSVLAASANPADQIKAEWQKMHKSKQAALEEFNNAKLGMFIHWGLYCIPGGVWKGEETQGIASWIMTKKAIPRAEYATLAEKFNPTDFNVESIVLLAKNAGMRYIVFTAKHHEGFAMYDSKVSEFDVMDASPFKRDVVKEFYDACKKHGIRLGLYYSHAIDWMDGGNGNAGKGRHWAVNHYDRGPVTYERYLNEKAKPQMEELLKNYPDLFSIWFDVPLFMTQETSFEFYKQAYDLQPQALCADRIGNEMGDYLVPGDNRIPRGTDDYDRPWEGIATMNNTWGYKRNDHDWKSTTELLYWTLQMVSQGGNFLLNIGPKPDGTVPKECVARLQDFGEWTRTNGEAIYGSRKWIVYREGTTAPMFRGTNQRKAKGFNASFTSQDIWYTTKGNNIYAMGLVMPNDGKITLKSFGKDEKAYRVKIKNIRLLGSDEKTEWSRDKKGISVQLPEKPPCKHGYALKLAREEENIQQTTWSDRLEYIGVCIDEPGYHVWGNSPVIGPEGKTHLFVARWPISAKFDPGWHTHSEVAHYVGDKPEGPFQYVETVLKNSPDGTTLISPHCPTAHKVDDKYVIFYSAVSSNGKFPSNQYIGMIYSDSLNGPWKNAGKDGIILTAQDDPDAWSFNSVVGVNNPALLQHPDGRFFLYYKAKESWKKTDPRKMGVAIAKNIEGPYIHHKTPVTDNDRIIEDGYAFIENGEIYMLTTDNNNRAGLLWRSDDGFNLEQVGLGFDRMETYINKKLVENSPSYWSQHRKFERPQILMVNDHPSFLYAASGVNINGGDGSCSYVIRINAAR